jgi:hypothetical protein
MARQECKDHALWNKNLKIAFWVVVILAYYLILFTDSILGPWLTIVGGFALLFTRIQLDKKHAKWHLSQEGNE